VQCYRGDIIRLEAAWRHRLDCAGEAACRPAVECYRRRQRERQYWPPYTMCKRASNNTELRLRLRYCRRV